MVLNQFAYSKKTSSLKDMYSRSHVVNVSSSLINHLQAANYILIKIIFGWLVSQSPRWVEIKGPYLSFVML